MTSSDLPQTVVLHLGAHKTASTHLQRSIGSAGALSGVAFAGPPVLRGKGHSLPERFGMALDPDNTSATPRSAPDALRRLANGAARLVLSEENFAGKLQTGWGRIPTPLYFTAPHRVASLAAAIAGAGGPPLDLCLAIRDPAGYLTSSYSQILHGRRVVDPDKFRGKNPVEAISWDDYVQRLRAVDGVGSITVWRYEDYTSLFHQICESLTGTTQITPLPDRIQPRLSAKAMEAVLLAKSLDGANVVAAAAEAFPVSDENPAYTLYDAATQETSARLYARQWDAICGLHSVTALRIGSA